MTDNESLSLVNKVFSEILEAHNILELKNVLDSNSVESKFRMSSGFYPRLNIRISSNEIVHLKEKKLLDKDFSLNYEEISKTTDPLVKLLYAALWKNRDVFKVKHIANGVCHDLPANVENEGALVFYNFGKHLNPGGSFPIVDQHVLRAYSVYTDYGNVQKYRKQNLVNDRNIISKYVDWIRSAFKKELMEDVDYMYHIDQTLFAVGKKIKSPKK